MKRSSCFFLILALALCLSTQLCAQSGDVRPELVPQTGHAYPIWKLAFSNDGKLLASATPLESAVVLWDVENERQLRTFNAGAGGGTSFLNGIRSLSLSPDGRVLAAGTDTGVIVWNVADGNELYHFVPNAQGFAANVGVAALEFSPSSHLLAAIEGNSIQIWDINNGNSFRNIPFQELIAGGTLAFSADEHTLAAAIYGASQDTSIRLFDLSSGNVQEKKITGHLSFLGTGGLAYTPEGRLLAVSESEGEGRKVEEEEIIVTDVTSGSRATLAKVANAEGGIGLQATLSRNGALVALSDKSTVRIFDTNSHREIRSLALPASGTLPFQFLVTAFSSDQKWIATGVADGRIKLYDPKTGELKKSLEGHANFATAAVFSQDGARLFTGAKTQWDLNSGIGLRATSQLNSPPLAIISADGHRLAALSLTDSTAQIWDLVQQKLLQTVRGPQDTVSNRFAISPDGSVLAISYREDFQAAGARERNQAAMMQRMKDYSKSSASAARKDPAQAMAAYQNMISGQGTEKLGAQIKLWNTATGAELTTLKGHVDDVGALIFAADGKKLISVAKGDVRTWDVASGKPLSNYQTEAPPPQSPYGIFGGTIPSQTYVNAAALSPDGQTLVIAERKMITQIDTAAMDQAMAQMTAARQNAQQRRSRMGGLIGNPLGGFGKKPQSAPVPKFDPSKGGIHIEGPLEVLNINNGQVVGSLPGHTSGADSVAFSPDGKLLASGGGDHVIRLWSMADGNLVHELTGNVSTIHALAFSPDGKLLVSSALDGATHLWDVSKGEQLATLFSINDGSDWLVVTPQGLFDGSPGAWNQILWRYGNNTFNVFPVEVFFNEYFYPGLLADIYAGKRPVPAVEIARKDRRQPEVALAVEHADTNARTVNLTLHINEIPADSQHQKGSGAKDLRLFRNGSLVKVWHGDVLHGKSEAMVSLSVPIIAGENRFTAYAFNSDNVKSRDAVSLVQGADSLRHPATTYVLAVGVNDYANPDYNLKFAVPDAQSFAARLKEKQESLPKKSKVEVAFLLNQDATRSKILDAISRIGQKVQPDDHVIIFFASHGTAAKNSFYIIPHDIGYTGSREQLDEAAVRSILAHSISDRDLEQALEAVDAAQIAVVIDACNSGQALEAEEKRRGPMNSKGLAQLAYEKGMYVLTASQSYQAALEASQLGHGLLTYALVEEGLGKNQADSEPADGKIVVREWLDYSTIRVPEIQTEKLQQARELRHTLAFGDSSKEHAGHSQYPKVFYRRELENNPWVVAESSPR